MLQIGFGIWKGQEKVLDKNSLDMKAEISIFVEIFLAGQMQFGVAFAAMR